MLATHLLPLNHPPAPLLPRLLVMERPHSPTMAPSVSTTAAWYISSRRLLTFPPIVDVYAPGQDIISAYPGGGARSLSGTSMASPHVCGLGAYLIALEGISGGSVCDRIQELANAAISNPGRSTTNKLIYNGSGR